MPLRQALRVFEPLVPGLLRPLVKRGYSRFERRWLALMAPRRERAYARRCGLPALPPAALRLRVAGDGDAEGFVRVGKRIWEDLDSTLKGIGRPLESFESLLDFGCGCGRQLLFLANLPKAPHCTGADIDSEAIAWCRRNLKFARFNVNGPSPPLPYSDGAFDLVWAVSVFTHFDEARQCSWLEELRRVTRPGAVLLLTLHGRHIWQHLPADLKARVERDGFLFARTGDWRDSFPDWYQTAYHTESYVLEVFGRFFKVVEHRPRGLADHQDMVVLRRS